MGWYRLRGLLKTFGLVVGTGVGGSFVRRVKQLADRRPSLSGAIHSLLDVLAAAAREIVTLLSRSLRLPEPMSQPND